MTDSDSDWGPIATPWKAHLTTILRTSAEARAAGAPPEWCDYLGEQGTVRLWAAWSSNQSELPLFNAYLHRELDRVAVGAGTIGHVLLYRFRDWIDDGDRFLPGVMVAGAPMTQQAAERAETMFGGLPPGLRAVWTRHAYVQLKNGSILGQPESATLYHTSTHDYLGIVGSGSSSPICVRRAHGESWSDDLFMFEPGTQTARIAPSLTVDSLLVDWATVRWPPEEYIDM